MNKKINIIESQLKAYNNRDIDEFVKYYSDDIEFRILDTNELVFKGMDRLREKYIQRFEAVNLHCTIVNRIEIGNKVIDEEEIIGVIDGIYHVVVIYETDDNFITKMWLVK